VAVFEYHGILSSTGKNVHGVRDADNPKTLRAALRREGILLTQAAEEQAAKATAQRHLKLNFLSGRVPVADLALMTRQLSTLIGAKIPLFESLSALIEQVERDGLRRALTNIRDQVREGTSFATALESHPKLFSGMYVNMVRAGEASGTLEGVLDRLTIFMESQSQLQGKIITALAYPILMMIIAGLLISVLMVAVVPKVVGIFQSMNRALPWYTTLLITVSRAVSGYWWLIGGGLALAITLFRRWKHKPAGKLAWDTLVLRMPIVGKLYQMVAIARFARTLGTLLAAGVPLLQAMGIVRTVLGNAALEKIIEQATGSIREGESIAEPLKRSKRFPPMVTHMIAIGEKSGQLEEMLDSVANAYDKVVETRVQMLTSLLEPLIILFMGGAVGFIAMSILFPLIQMSEFVN
jgi:general secretion pathway protein F